MFICQSNLNHASEGDQKLGCSESVKRDMSVAGVHCVPSGSIVLSPKCSMVGSKFADSKLAFLRFIPYIGMVQNPRKLE